MRDSGQRSGSPEWPTGPGRPLPGQSAPEHGSGSARSAGNERTERIGRPEPGARPEPAEPGRTGGAAPVGDEPTTALPRTAPSPSEASKAGWHAASTEPIPAVVPEPGLDHATEQANEQTQVLQSTAGESTGRRSLLRATGSMAVATLFSRITGFLWKVMLAWAVGYGVVNDSFMVANNLPNSVFEFLIGGVLTSVIVPVLVRAQKSDADGGESYIQRLLTLAIVVLGVGTVLSVIGASWLVALYASGEGSGHPKLATAFAYLLLPQIFFYGLSALIGAILQSKERFSTPAWAPVLNNVVVIGTIIVYFLLPGRLTIDPLRMSDAHLLTLGIGVTLGVVAQAIVQVPALRRAGIRMRWRWGWDPRLTEFGGLAAWMIGYVAVSQFGLMAMSKAGTEAGAWSMYQYVWMLLQLPYGVLGFSVMTAILPRMSAAAADGDTQRVIEDLSLGTRLSTVTMLPVSAVMAAVGPPFGLALFSLGRSAGDAGTVGTALAMSAFGVLPYALTMMQMRVFYALKDARTPTVIMLLMSAFKIPLSLLTPQLGSTEAVLYALSIINSASFVLGWIIGEVWLRYRLGPLGSRRFLTTLGKTLVASVLGGLLAWLVTLGVDALIPGPAGGGTGWIQLSLGSIVGFVSIFALCAFLRVAELRSVIERLAGLVRRR